MTTDKRDELKITVCNFTQSDFSKYSSECKKLGFNQNLTTSTSKYTAENDKYSLSLEFFQDNNEMDKFINSVQTYFRGVRAEWGKISWPEKKQVVTETVFVVIIVFVFTVAIYLMDIIFKGLFGLIK